MTSITGVNLRRLGLHITTPLRVTTTTGRKEAPLEASAPAGGIMGIYGVAAFVISQCNTGPFRMASPAQDHVISLVFFVITVVSMNSVSVKNNCVRVCKKSKYLIRAES